MTVIDGDERVLGDGGDGDEKEDEEDGKLILSLEGTER
jgi:hypothetical protein